jgi:signal transduction histidine kinase
MSEDPQGDAAALRALIEPTRGALRFQADHGRAPAGVPVGMLLSISQKIVEARGGALWGAANREGGETFSFTLTPAHTPRGCDSP